MATTRFRFTLVLAVVFFLLVGVGATSCPSGCQCHTEVPVDSGVQFYTVYCNYNDPFDGGINEIFFNKSLSRSNFKNNVFYFNNLYMPVWRNLDSKVIAGLANVNAVAIEIELRETSTGLISEDALQPLENFTVSTLRLHSLGVTELYNNTFAPLRKLKSIYISSFVSGTSQGNFFYSLPGLTSLNVLGSEEFVKKDILNGDHHLYSLQNLDLRNNNLKAIPKKILSRMPNLQSFHLEHNQLTEFEVDLCHFLLNRTSTANINIYLESNKICNFDYVIDRWRNCILPSNKVVHIHIRAAKNYHCDVKYFRLDPINQSLTISVGRTGRLSNCKTPPCSTTPSQRSTTQPRGVSTITPRAQRLPTSVTTSETTSATPTSTTQRTSVTAETTTTSATTASTSVTTSKTTSSTHSQTTLQTSVTSETTTTSTTKSSTTSSTSSTTSATTSSTHRSTVKSTTIATTRGTSLTTSQSTSSIRAVNDQPQTDHQYKYKYKPLGTGVLVAIGLGGVVVALVAVWIVRKYAGANIQNQRRDLTVSHTPGLIEVDPRPQTGIPLSESDTSHPGSPTGPLPPPIQPPSTTPPVSPVQSIPLTTLTPPDQPIPPIPIEDPLLEDDMYINPPTPQSDMGPPEASSLPCTGSQSASSIPPDGALSELAYEDVSPESQDCHIHTNATRL